MVITDQELDDTIGAVDAGGLLRLFRTAFQPSIGVNDSGLLRMLRTGGPQTPIGVTDDVQTTLTFQRLLSNTVTIFDELFTKSPRQEFLNLSDVISTLDESRYTFIRHVFLEATQAIADGVTTGITLARLISDSVGVVDEAFAEQFLGIILSVLVSPDPATICEFLTVITQFIQLPISAQAEIDGQVVGMTVGAGSLVGKAVFRAFDLGFITNETVTVTTDPVSVDTSATATVVDIDDILNPMRNTVIAALQAEPEFAGFTIIEELPQSFGFTGPTIFLETITGNPEAQGLGGLHLVNSSFRVFLVFPEGMYRMIGGNTVDKTTLVGHFLDVLSKVLNNVDLSVFDVSEKRVFSQTHSAPIGNRLIFYGCMALLSVNHRGVCK